MANRRRGPRCRARWLACALLLLLSLASGTADRTKEARGEQLSSEASPTAPVASSQTPKPPEVVIVSTDEPWLVAVMAPAVATLREQEPLPLLIAADMPPGNEVESLVRVVAPRRCLIVLPETNSNPLELPGAPDREVLTTGCSPLSASRIVAKRFWGESRSIVVASVDEPEAAILGSTLATHLASPLMLHDGKEEGRCLSNAIRELRAKKVFVSASRSTPSPSWTRALGVEVRTLDPRAVQKEVARALGATNVRNVILARAPELEHGAGPTAWLAPYWSLARRSPVVLSRSKGAERSEAAVNRLIRTCRLRPDTVTILADCESIGTNQVTIPLDGQNQEAGAYDEGYGDEYDGTMETYYEVATEPCMPTGSAEAATLGVGRIPFASLEKASIMLARGLARERLLAARPPRLLMVANPTRDDLVLPLCETVSRVTASEFKNAGILVDEFYGQPSDSPETRQAAAGAQLILYEGHLYHQRLFSDPSDSEEDYEDYDYEKGSEFYETVPDFPDQWRDDGQEDLESEFLPYPLATDWTTRRSLSEDEPLGPRAADALFPSRFFEPEGLPSPRRARTLWGTFPTCQQPKGTWETCPTLGSAPPEPISAGSASTSSWVSLTLQSETAAKPTAEAEGPPQLDGLPVVVLQTCDSLEPDMFRRIQSLGGVALVGSVSHIHSGSGSSLVKAICDGMLYRGGTLGEAMRDAQNYFFCLQDLKDRRGHRQQPKGRRVALSFQLWGDPQLRVFPQPMHRPRIAPVSAEWEEPDKLHVSVPARRLETGQTEKYFVRIFPGSQTAGLVRRLKNKPLRRVTPVYFFRLPLPESFARSRFTSVSRPDDKPNRAVFRVDPAGRFLYVLYYPDQETPDEDFTLQFEK